MARKLVSILVDVLIATIAILFFAGFGDTPSVVKATVTAWKLIDGAFTGHLQAGTYNDVTWPAIWVSLRLIAMGTLFSCLFGLAHTMVSVRLHRKLPRAFDEFLTTLFQSLPEAMYVVIVFLVLVYLLAHGINLPGLLHDGIPRLQDTFAPAVAIGIPGALYLRRILSQRLEDEEKAMYVSTALAKGASSRRTFYTHVFPNILPLMFRQIPVVAGFSISSALFAEYFLGYMGLLFRFPMFVGWDNTSGASGLNKPTGIPSYQMGAVFVTGLFLVACWLIFQVVSQILSLRFPQDVEPASTAKRRSISKSWIVAGSILIAMVITVSAFPQVLTTHNPNAKYLVDTSNWTEPPFAPSHTYLLGTDAAGRDLLAQTLHGTFASLRQVVAITVLVTIGALGLSTLAMLQPGGWLSRIVVRIGRIWSAFPVLLIVFLALYHRNLLSHYQELQFICWIGFFEIGRASLSFYGAMVEWNQFGFIEGATSIGQSRIRILYRQLGSWLGQFTLEFIFAEFTRVLSLITLLAMLHTYAVDKLTYFAGTPPILAVVSGQTTWFTILGDQANQVFNIVTHPFLIYGPVIALTLMMLGTSFIARGLRGTRV